MSDLDRLQDAFMKADALAQQGDEQAKADATLFAQEIRRLQAGAQPEVADESEGFMPQLNKAIAQTAGGLVDFINPFDEYTGSAAAGLENLMEAGGIDVAQQAPKGFAENVAYGAGSAAASLLPVTKGVQLLQQAPGMVGKVAQTLAPQMVAPKAVAGELVAGGLAAGGAGEAERQGYSEPVQQIVGLLSGISPAAIAPAARLTGRAIEATPIAGTAIKTARAEIAPFTSKGAREIVSRRVREMVGGDESAEAIARSLDEPSLLRLSPAEMSGDPRLMEFQRAAAAKDPNIEARMSQRQFETDVAAREGLEIGGRVEDAQLFVAQRQADFDNTLNSYVAAAEASAQKKMPKAGMDPIAASNVVAAELRQAEKVAKANQKMLWDKIPRDVEVDVSDIRSTIQSLSDTATRIGRENIPPEATAFLKATKDTGTDRIDEINSLYSAMRDTARRATAGENVNNNKARIANSIADSILTSLDNIRPDTDVNRSIVEARTFSRQMHDKFSRGEVGKLLKRTGRGGDAVPENLTLQRSIGSGGDAGFVAQQDIAAATRDFPETGNATANYLRSLFNEKVFSGKKFSPAAADKFLSANQRLLDEFPSVRSEIEQSIASQSRLKDVTSRASALSQSVKTSTSTSFAKASPQRAIDAVISAPNPRKAMASLIATTKKDTTGAALEGIKKAVSQKLLSQAVKVLDAPTRAGETSQIRFTRLSEALDDEVLGGIAKQALSPREMRHMRIIAKELEKLDLARIPSSTGQAMSMFEPNGLIAVAARIAGAQAGGRFGGGVGGSLQTSQILSARAKRILDKLTNSKAQQLMLDIVEDRELLRSMLLNTNVPGNADKLEKALTPYLIGATVSAGTTSMRED
jgi:hypothetical protein